MNMYYYLWETTDLHSTVIILSTLFLIGFFFDSVFLTLCSLIRKNIQEGKKSLKRVMLILPLLIIGFFLLFFLFPQSLIDILQIDLTDLLRETIGLLHGSFLVYSAVTLGYAIYLKLKKQPGAFWHIKKFSLYFILSIFFLSIFYMEVPYSGIRFYMISLLIFFGIFHFLYYIYRKYTKVLKNITEQIKKKVNYRYVFFVEMLLVAVCLVILFSLSYNSSQRFRETPPPPTTEEEDVPEPDSLESVEYEEITVTEDSTGLIYFLEKNDSHLIIFQDDATGKEYTLTRNLFSNEYEHLISNPLRPQYINSSIYFLLGSSTNPTLQRFDIFTGEINEVKLEYDESAPIHDFLIKGTSLYYLAGEFCNEYMAQCNLELKGYNLSTLETVTLAKEISSREIAGFNQTGRIIFLQYREGDAGCSWHSFEEFNMDTEKLSAALKYSYCYDLENDPHKLYSSYEDSYNQLKSYEEKIYGIKSVPYLIIKDSTITFAEESNNSYEEDHIIPLKVTY